MSSQVLNISKLEDFPASLGNLLQGLTTLTVKKFPLLLLMLVFLLYLVHVSDKNVSLLCCLPLGSQSQIPWEPSVPKAEHTQLLQLFHHCSSLWPSGLHSTALAPICPSISCTGRHKTGHSTADPVSQLPDGGD